MPTNLEPIQIGTKGTPSWLQRPSLTEDHFSKIAQYSRLTPFNHQRSAVNQGIEKLLEDGFFGLFMDMGTGKTKTTIDIFSVLLNDSKAGGMVVICPKPLMMVWEDEIPKQSAIQFSIYRWDNKKTKKADKEYAAFMEEIGPKVFIINIEAFQVPNDTMRERLFGFMNANPCLCVVDESSYIKESKAQRTKNITAFGNRLPYRIILTGTEIVNSPLDLFAQFEFLKKGFWDIKSFYLFQLKYAILADQYGSGGRTFKKVVGYQKLEEILSKITPYVFRARKEECLDLPEKIHQTLRVELSVAQKAAYSGLKKHLITVLESGEVLSVKNKVSLFTKFRQIAGGTVKCEGEFAVIEETPPKLQVLLSDLESCDEQAIIWACFTHEIEMLEKHLSKIGSVVTFYGDTEQDDRKTNVHLFQEGKARFFIGNPQSAGFGLNLQTCHLQYVYSRHLSPAVNWQAEDRTHRPGQRSVCVYKSLVAIGTVDERVELLLEDKRKTRDAFRSMDPIEVARFNTNQNEEIINPSTMSIKELLAILPEDTEL